MIKIFTSLSLALLGLLAQAQTSETRNVSKFTRMEVGNHIEVVYTPSAAPSVTVSDTNITAEVVGDVLRINTALPADNTYKVYVSGNDLNYIKADGAKITVYDQWSAANLTLILEADAAFAGNIRPTRKLTLVAGDHAMFNGRVDAPILDVTLTGNAKANLTGNTEAATVHAGDRAVCLAGNFTAVRLSVSAEDYATVKIHAPDALAIAVSERARVAYTGKPATLKMNENAVAVDSFDRARAAVAAK